MITRSSDCDIFHLKIAKMGSLSSYKGILGASEFLLSLATVTARQFIPVLEKSQPERPP